MDLSQENSRGQVDELEAPSSFIGQEDDSSIHVTKEVDEMEAPSCCKGETVSTNTYCEQDLAACKPECCCQSDVEKEPYCLPSEKFETSGNTDEESCSEREPGGPSRSSLQNNDRETCSAPEIELEPGIGSSESEQKMSGCHPKKQLDGSIIARVKSRIKGNAAVEKRAQTSSCCQRRPCYPSKTKCDHINSCEKSCYKQSVRTENSAETTPCCANELCSPSKMKYGDDVDICTENCSHIKEKLLPNKHEGESICKSKDFKVDWCKAKENTVLLIEPRGEKDLAPSSITTVKAKESQGYITTKLRVHNLCCAMESKLVKECLTPLNGVEKVAVNVVGRVVYVKHDPVKTLQADLLDTLNRVHLGASVMEMGSQCDEEQENVPFRMKLLFIYVVLQTVLLIIAVTGLFLKQPWYVWVAITEIIFGGVPILKRVVISVKNRNLDINILIFIAIIGTLAISEWVEGASVVYIFSFADALQKFCMFRVQRTLSRLMLKRPEVAVLAATGESVPIENVAMGTQIAVRPGELVPLDGVVVKGKAAVDESSITGESLPVEKTVFSKVYSGTVNQNGYIELETTSDSSTSTVSKVMQMVQEAQSSSTKTEEIINRFAKYYTPLVVLVAALVVIIPAILGASGVGSYLQDIREWGRRALVMLVIACPCALVMATPIPVVCSITAAARKGVLVKGGDHLETLSKIKVLAFDKTGTLTEGNFQVMHMECAYEENEREVLRLAAGLESKTVHPIAAAIVNEFLGCVGEMVMNEIDDFPEVSQFKMYEGQGISGLIEGKLVRVGNKEMVDQCGATLNETMAKKYELWSTDGKTVVFVCVDEKLVLMIGLADAIRPNTSITLDWLRDIGVQTSMITGDNSRTAEAVRRNLGIDECASEMKPNEKLAWIQQKQTNKVKRDPFLSADEEDQSWKCCSLSRDGYVVVGMVGDGVNDGPALASANVGIALGAGGTALAVEAADVALMSNNLASITELISLSKFFNQIVKQNIVFSVLLKVCIVIVALLGYVTLWIAVVVDVLGLLFVILNGLRPLLNFRLFDWLFKPKVSKRVNSTFITTDDCSIRSQRL